MQPVWARSRLRPAQRDDADAAARPQPRPRPRAPAGLLTVVACAAITLAVTRWLSARARPSGVDLDTREASASAADVSRETLRARERKRRRKANQRKRALAGADEEELHDEEDAEPVAAARGAHAPESAPETASGTAADAAEASSVAGSDAPPSPPLPLPAAAEPEDEETPPAQPEASPPASPPATPDPSAGAQQTRRRTPPPPYRPPPDVQHAPPSEPWSLFAASTPRFAVPVEAPPQLSPPPSPPAAADAGGGLCALVHALFHVRCFREYVLLPGAFEVSPAADDAAQRSAALARELQSLFEALAQGAPLLCDPPPLRAALLSAGGAPVAAAAALGTLLDAFQAVAAAQRPGVPQARTAMGRLFTICTRAAVHCAACQLASRKQLLRPHALAVRAAALRAAHAAAGGGACGFEALLHGLQCAERDTCDPDEGGCGFLSPVVHALERAPQVFTISITAEPPAQAPPDEAQVAATFKALSTSLHPELLFGRSGASAAESAHYELRALLCGGGGGHACFARYDAEHGAAYASSTPVWMRFDAAGAAAVGGWAAVCDACARARLQPETLFFERTLTIF